MKLQRFGWKDLLFLATLLLCGILLTAGIYLHAKDGQFVRITIGGAVYGTYPLDEDQEISVESDGERINLVRIRNGSVSMEQATCPDELCVKQGSISKTGQTIVCLPHELVVEVYGTDEKEYDAISR